MSTFYGWLSVDPPLLLHTSNDKLFQYLPEQPLARIQVYPWHHSADEIYAFHEHDRRHRPHDRLYHCVNTAETCAALRARGVDVEFVTPNAFLDERRYRVLGEAARPVQAVYNGRMNPFKRHWLAREIRSLMIIGGVYAPDDTWEYFDEVRGVLPHAWFTHAENHLFRTPDEVTELLNHARIGLCLSACEGAMYAATEYLLCGLPVVSTASPGGPRFVVRTGIHADRGGYAGSGGGGGRRVGRPENPPGRRAVGDATEDGRAARAILFAGAEDLP